MIIKPISNWGALAAAAKRRGIRTVGEFLVALAFQGIAPDAAALRVIRRVYRADTEE